MTLNREARVLILDLLDQILNVGKTVDRASIAREYGTWGVDVLEHACTALAQTKDD